MTIGKPCPALNGVCTIYEDRPFQPCQTYKCQWLAHEDIPLWIKPEHSGAILDTRQSKSNVWYLKLTPVDEMLYSAEVLSWAIEYAQHNQVPLIWNVGSSTGYAGDKEICTRIIEELKVESEAISERRE
jgi:hypothetical protein